jgi:hypothetical protein
MAKNQITWKRNQKSTGLASIGSSNSLRAWILVVNGQEIGSLSHTRAHALNRGEPAWRIWIFRQTEANVLLNKQFPTTASNEAQVAEAAKKWMVETYPAIKERYLTPPAPAGQEPQPQEVATPKEA